MTNQEQTLIGLIERKNENNDIVKFSADMMYVIEIINLINKGTLEVYQTNHKFFGECLAVKLTS